MPGVWYPPGGERFIRAKLFPQRVPRLRSGLVPHGRCDLPARIGGLHRAVAYVAYFLRLTKSRCGVPARRLSRLALSSVPGCHSVYRSGAAVSHGGERPQFAAYRTATIRLRWRARCITILHRPTCSYIGIVSFHSQPSFPPSAVFPAVNYTFK